MTLQVVRCDELPDSFVTLDSEARAEGFDFLSRLAARWRTGHYLGDADATLFALFSDSDLIAIGAQTSDEYEPGANVRRMRHVYVHPGFRRNGVGRTLAGALVQEGFQLAPLLTLNATHAASRAFWESVGFSPVPHSTRSHEMRRDAWRP